MSPRRTRLVSPFLAAFALTIVLSGCATNTGPTRYTDEVRDNYRRACLEANAARLSTADAEAYCSCTYDGLASKIPFADFKRFDEEVRDRAGDELRTRADLQSEFPEIVALFESCVTQGPTPPAPPTTASAPTSR